MPLSEHVHALRMLLGGLLGLSVLWWLTPRRPSRAPPGPGFALPLLGHLHLMGKDPRPKFHKWRQEYGDVFSLYLGNRLVVVFSSYSVIREAFVKFGSDFANRPHMLTTDRLAENRGIVLASGPAWKEQRKTALEILRELGVGSNKKIEKIHEEVEHYIGAIGDLEGGAADLHRLTTLSVCNNISSILFGTRFQYDDPLFNKYFDAVDENFRRLGSAAVVNFIPFLEYVPGDVFGLQRILSNMEVIRGQFLQSQIDDHLHRSADGEASDFVFAYLERMRRKQQDGMATTLSEPQLSTTTGDLVVAGTETTSSAILWSLLLLLHHPHVQDRCYQEICDIIGINRLPDIRDKSKMVYLEAFIQEVLRTVSIGTFAIYHAPRCDVIFRGYSIPEDTVILPFMDTVLHDPKIWGDPENFRPERFINANRKLTNPAQFIPFSTGCRSCLGEAFARTELFVYLSTLIQKFRFLPPEPENVPPVEGILGATHSPKPFKIKTVRRE